MTLETWLAVVAAGIAVGSAVIAVLQARAAGSQAKSATRQADAAEKQVSLMQEQVLEARMWRQQAARNTELDTFLKTSQMWLAAAQTFIDLSSFRDPYNSMYLVREHRKRLDEATTAALLSSQTRAEQAAVRAIARWTEVVTSAVGRPTHEGLLTLWGRHAAKRHFPEAQSAITRLEDLTNGATTAEREASD